MEVPDNMIISRDLVHGTERSRWILQNSSNAKDFMEEDIIRMTNHYSNCIGRGGFGIVYRGVDDDHGVVAVKRYIRSDLKQEFMEEVRIHSQINHKNVVKLIGYCIGRSNLIMVTEYISKGNLDDTLHNTVVTIPLDIRLGIAIGIAEALRYMHSMHLSSDSLVCHGDIKPANILLDGNFTAKVSDFGLSRLLSGGISRYTRNAHGSIDYMDPVLLKEGRLSPRSDVYSFGIVILELITRKRVRRQGAVNLIEAFRKPWFTGKGFRRLYDARIASTSNMKILDELAKLAVKCLSLNIGKRPRMNNVVERLRVLWKVLRGGKHIGQPSRNIISEMDVKYSKIVQKLGHNVRVWTLKELIQATHNFLERHSWRVYKGTLEDNTVVLVKILCGQYPDRLKHEFINEGMILSQVVHRNIIKLLGYCLEDGALFFIYECATNGSLSDIMYRTVDCPLDIRVKIAVKIAEVLEYLHSSSIGKIAHGGIVPSSIFLDDMLMPMLSGFSNANRLISDRESASTAVDQVIKGRNSHIQNVATLETDVYDFGLLLLALISRRHYTFGVPGRHLIPRFIEAYERNNSGKTMFDKDIVAEEDIAIFDNIGRLALMCTCLEGDERPTMKDVVERLWTIRESWNRRCTA